MRCYNLFLLLFYIRNYLIITSLAFFADFASLPRMAYLSSEFNIGHADNLVDHPEPFIKEFSPLHGCRDYCLRSNYRTDSYGHFIKLTSSKRVTGNNVKEWVIYYSIRYLESDLLSSVADGLVVDQVTRLVSRPIPFFCIFHRSFGTRFIDTSLRPSGQSGKVYTQAVLIPTYFVSASKFMLRLEKSWSTRTSSIFICQY